MKDIKVVIGANFGDEGKGLMTDYFASKATKGLVVRFNGGAQASHTVCGKDGFRHAFSHFGSGTLVGLPTYLSKFYVTNPMFFVKELAVLQELGVTPEIYIDGDCLVTTPYDIMVNQILELYRGASKHGSCGMGFNATIERSEMRADYRIVVADLFDEALTRSKLDNIRLKAISFVSNHLGFLENGKMYSDLLENPNITNNFILDCKTLLTNTVVADIRILSLFDTIIFEGAQGLLLDQNHKYFPHVTRSNTGMKNVAELLNLSGLTSEHVDITYVTRAYLTRHGVGPFPTELPEKPSPNIIDLTNVPNTYQDALRYGTLDLDALATQVFLDLENAKGLNYTMNTAITCLDQLGDEIDYILKGETTRTVPEKLFLNILSALNCKLLYTSYGASRETIKIFS